MTEPRLAGIELGGTKCIAVLSHGQRIIASRAVPTATPGETLAAMAAVLADWWSDAPFAAIGIAAFGPIALDPARTHHGRVLPTPKPGWTGADVLAPFRQFGVPLALDTDVNAAALADWLWGDAQGMGSNAYVTIGTGLGVGIVVEGRPVHGLQHPEFGHLRVRRSTLDADFRGVCPFHGDCAEGLIAGPALAARTGRPGASLPAEHPVWRAAGEELGELLAALMLAVSPQRITLGGSVALGQPHLLPLATAHAVRVLAGYVAGIDADGVIGMIAASRWGAQAGLYGALALACSA